MAKQNSYRTTLGLLALCAALGGCAKPPASSATSADPASPQSTTPATATPTPAPVAPALSRDELMAQYIDKVRRLIRSRMVYKGKQGNPEVLIEVSLQPDMRVKAVKMVKTSGNKAFDRAVKRAIEKVGSYPALPEGLDFSIFMTHKIKYRLHDLL